MLILHQQGRWRRKRRITRIDALDRAFGGPAGVQRDELADDARVFTLSEAAWWPNRHTGGGAQPPVWLRP
jgi:hypothetical protein